MRENIKIIESNSLAKEFLIFACIESLQKKFIMSAFRRKYRHETDATFHPYRVPFKIFGMKQLTHRGDNSDCPFIFSDY